MYVLLQVRARAKMGVGLVEIYDEAEDEEEETPEEEAARKASQVINM